VPPALFEATLEAELTLLLACESALSSERERTELADEAELVSSCLQGLEPSQISKSANSAGDVAYASATSLSGSRPN
jgi:hypothetical protein